MDLPRGSKGPLMFGLEITAVMISTCIMVARVYIRARISKALGLDDYLAIVAWVFMVSMSAVDLYCIHYGGGTSMDQLSFKQLTKFFSLLPVSLLLYFPTISLVRLSILAFLPRLNREKWFMWCIWALAFVIAVNTLFPFFHILTQCMPIIDLFRADQLSRRCRSAKEEQPIMYAQSAIGIVIDICLFGLPILVIRKTMIFSEKMSQVIVVFGVGLLVNITGIIRLVVFITTDFSVNPTYKTIYLGPLTLFELHVGFWCGCFPALQPLIRAIASRFHTLNSKTSHKNVDPYPGNSDTGQLHRSVNTLEVNAMDPFPITARGAIMAQVEDVHARPTSEIVELDRLRVSRTWEDIRVSFENGKATYKAPWDAV